MVHDLLVRSHPDEFTIYDERLLFRSHGSPMSTHGYYVGEFEYHVLSYLLANVGPDMLVLDIGAHHGEFAVPIAFEFRQHGWDSRVLSFEPDPDNARLLQANLASNGLTSLVEVHQEAVADTCSVNSVLLCPRDNSSNSLAVNERYAIGDESASARRLVVPTVTVDSLQLDRRVGVIKLDIQGSEPDALRGAAATIQRDHPILVLEVVADWPRADEVREILDDLGYDIYGLSAEGQAVPLGDRRVFVSWDWVATPRHRAGSDATKQNTL